MPLINKNELLILIVHALCLPVLSSLCHMVFVGCLVDVFTMDSGDSTTSVFAQSL